MAPDSELVEVFGCSAVLRSGCLEPMAPGCSEPMAPEPMARDREAAELAEDFVVWARTPGSGCAPLEGGSGLREVACALPEPEAWFRARFPATEGFSRVLPPLGATGSSYSSE